MKQHHDLIAELKYCCTQRAEIDTRLVIAMTSVIEGLALSDRMTNESDDVWLTVKQVADIMQCSTDYVYEHKEEWPFTRKHGGRWKFSRRGLDRWMDTQ